MNLRSIGSIGSTARRAGTLVACMAALAQGDVARGADLPDLIPQVLPAVVRLRTTVPPRPKPVPPDGSGETDELFRRFWPREGQDGANARGVSHGTGFIAAADGYVVTAGFIVGGNPRIEVELSDGRIFDARLLGSDRHSDTALLKIEAQGLPVIRFGNAGALRLGERVFAIGVHFGMGIAVTDGIVSQIGVDQPGKVRFLQTTASINPGGGGGPLFNMRGEVVGMNHSIYSRTGAFSGIAFAVPEDVVRRVYEELRRSGRVSYGRIGIHVAAAPRAGAAGGPRGALVAQVDPGGPAERAGVREHDIIVGFGGVPVESDMHLVDLVRGADAAKPVAVDIVRGGRRSQVLVRVDVQ